MKRTTDNCKLIKEMVKCGTGKPQLESDGTCLGYQRSDIDDEPCSICSKCKLCSGNG